MGRPVVIHHSRYLVNYPTVAVESPERVRVVFRELSPFFRMVEPEPASGRDLRRVHTRRLVEEVRRTGDPLFETARLAAGGALRAAREALAGTPAFALIRPPGHHASPDHNWGFCFFNNMAVALAALLEEGSIGGAFVLDFDLHFGDGTVNCFAGDSRVKVFNPPGTTGREAYLESVRSALEEAETADIVGVSAGFDNGEMDWGGLLTTGDFFELGRLVRGAALRFCLGRRFALLEGGYHLPDLGRNCLAFCRGLFDGV